MNHCSLCHQDYEGWFQHKKECSGRREVDCPKCGTVKQRKLKAYLSEKIKEGDLENVEGPFGEQRNIGFVDQSRSGDNYTKFYGCEYIYPIRVRSGTLDRLATVKRTIIETLQLYPVVLYFIVRRKKFFNWLGSIYEADLKKHEPKEWSPVPKEIVRAGERYINTPRFRRDYALVAEALRRSDYPGDLDMVLDELNIVVSPQTIERYAPKHKKRFMRLRAAMRTLKVFKLLAMVPQDDCAYYFRVMDFINLYHERGFRGAIDEAIRREKDLSPGGRGIAWKYELMKRFSFVVSPIAGRILDLTEPIPVTEADRYFAYQRQGYGFEGKGWEERLEWARERDREKGNVIFTE